MGFQTGNGSHLQKDRSKISTKGIFTVYYTNGVSNLRTAEKVCKYCLSKGQNEIQKRVKHIIENLKSDWT